MNNLQSIGSGLTSTYTDRLLQRINKDLSVTDLASIGGFGNLSNVNVNSPFKIMAINSLLSLIGILMATAFGSIVFINSAMASTDGSHIAQLQMLDKVAERVEETGGDSEALLARSLPPEERKRFKARRAEHKKFQLGHVLSLIPLLPAIELSTLCSVCRDQRWRAGGVDVVAVATTSSQAALRLG